MGPNLSLKILFIVPYAPTQIRTRPLNLIKALVAAGHRITLATLWSDKEDLDAIRSLNGTLEGLIAEKIPAVRSIWNCIQALPGRNPIQSYYSWNPRLAERITASVQTQHFDVVHVEHLRGAKYALMINEKACMRDRKHPPVVWDSVDCISNLFTRASQHSHTFRARLVAGFELPRTKGYEGWLATQFARVLVTSESDCQGLLRLAEEHHRKIGLNSTVSVLKRIAVVPNGVDLNYFSPTNEAREPQTIVITGKMSYHANITAVVRFVTDIMPRIWADLPRTQLWIVGRNPSPEIQRLGALSVAGGIGNYQENGATQSRVHITGTVADIRPYLRKAAVAVAPIRYGVGIQNKVLEAMACGTPVVATREALGDLRASPGQDLIVAEGDRELSQSILALLKNPELCSMIGLAGRAFVEANHNWQGIAQGLTGIYRDAVS